MSVNPVESEVGYDPFLRENGHKLPGDVVGQPGMTDVDAALAGVSVCVRIIEHSPADKFLQKPVFKFLNTHAVNLAAAPVMADGVRTMSGQALECYREVLKSG